jgi:gas vesicle structural protein
MAVERISGGSSLIDVLDRVLDKGIVIDAWVRISLVGIDLITVEARVVVASIDTYLKYADAVGLTGIVSRPQAELPPAPEVDVIETTRRTTRAPLRRKTITAKR